MPRVKSISTNHGSEPDAQVESAADSIKSAEDSNRETPSILPAAPSPAYLRSRLLEVASALRTEFSSLLQDPQVEKEAVQYFARLLGPNRKAGRPKRADVTEALRLEAEGVSRQQIYRRLSESHRLKAVATVTDCKSCSGRRPAR